MTENEMKENFNEDEIKAIIFGYRIEGYITEIIRIKEDGYDWRKSSFGDDWSKDIDLVYNTYKKSLKTISKR